MTAISVSMVPGNACCHVHDMMYRHNIYTSVYMYKMRRCLWFAVYVIHSVWRRMYVCTGMCYFAFWKT